MAAGTSVAVTLVAVLGGVGVISAETSVAAAGSESAGPGSSGSSESSGSDVGASGATVADVEESDAAKTGVDDSDTARPSAPTTDALPGRGSTALPPRSGTGRRVVFSESRQRVWLVGSRGGVWRTYLVSGSLYDNLDPGSYEVFSRSEQAWGIDDSGTMRWFVRFARGPNAAIGFHDIPIDDGARVQTVAELGSPTSHGCIRQRTPDAKALWAFAPVGTTVVVTT
ncbi:L,D-transpeptidase [Nocardioides donggukensis]|uniref:L,D-transpeptidase n=1 Tax=Nocardioides donggukensis TaxID=2774019 RepID=A0A927K6V4_9ACTN|nr:L,D-transpeptidase [Nocardioides donggukensis]MBD8870245.1 L,D-transpeptidase [Nocardioides donggukensis]